MISPSSVANVLGNTSLDHFDAIVIGSGAGGAPVAYTLAKLGRKVLVLEGGNNYFDGLDDPQQQPTPRFSNDELKQRVRRLSDPDPLLDPRTFRHNASTAAEHIGAVNNLPKTVGGAAGQSVMVVPRFHPDDFRLGSLLGTVPDATFVDWPLAYDELAPFYTLVEQLIGVQGPNDGNPWSPTRSEPYPMQPGLPALSGQLLADAASQSGYQPYPLPMAINSRPYRGRPACSDCGYCAEYGCPTNAKGAPAVTFLRDALLSGNCQLRFNAAATRLLTRGDQRVVTAVEYRAPEGILQQVSAEVVVLAASPIEDVRLLLLSDPTGAGLGNGSGLVGRNLMFHLLSQAIGVMPFRVHGHRGRNVSLGMGDFRGDPRAAQDKPLGGIVEFGAPSEPIFEAKTYALTLNQRGETLVRLMQQSPLRDRLLSIVMLGKDAPQANNRVDLDPGVRDIHGRPVPRITYSAHPFELTARAHYAPRMIELFGRAGAKMAALVPAATPPETKHIMGTLRMGTDAKASVCAPTGRLHELDNLYCADGALFPTSAGYNPLLTIHALALRVAAGILFPGSPERALAALR